MLDATSIALALTERFGVQMSGIARKEEAGLRAEFRPSELPPTCGFTVSVLIGWRTVEVEFAPAAFARQLLTAMAQAEPAKRQVFEAFVQTAFTHGAVVTFSVNGQAIDVLSSDPWPSSWQSLTFRMSKGPMAIANDPEALRNLALAWSARMLGSVLALMPLEPVEAPSPGEAEGGGNKVLVTRYERSLLNRAACIEIRGTKCLACGFDFEAFYGPVGAGFIEVHHVETLASLAPGTILDPATDLVPLCSNCHSIAHRRRPVPYSMDDLKAMIIRTPNTPSLYPT